MKLPLHQSFPLLGLAVCLLCALIGVALLDDYGASVDEAEHHKDAIDTVDYILGDADALPDNHNRFYGLSFELPLLLVERALGLRDSRSIYLVRHLLNHLLFIVGGFFCGLLAYRMFGSRWLALVAMLMFLLHPRLYAHSFFNLKDIPFLAMFMIALYFSHRAFRKETIGAFVLCGICTGLAANLRIFGWLLLPALSAMRGLDWWQAGGTGRRKPVLLTGLAFVAANLLTIYVAAPVLWENPLRLLDAFEILSQHPSIVTNLFQGQAVESDAVPPHYIPTWFTITAPPFMLLLGGLGAAAVCAQGIAQPSRTLRNGRLRFLFLVLGCLTLPVLVAIALNSNIYDGWRHLYFLWAPFCLLAIAGLRWLAGPQDADAARPGRKTAYALAGLGLASVVVAMASLHPHQQVYFNRLADREAPGGLPHRYGMDHFGASYRQALEWLLENYSFATLRVRYDRFLFNNRLMLPAEQRKRILLSDAATADFHITNNKGWCERWMPLAPVVYRRQAYGGDYIRVVAPRLAWGGPLRPDADAYRSAHRSVVAAGGPVERSVFDIYAGEGLLHYVKEDCALADTEAPFFLHLIPVNEGDLPACRRQHGYDNRDFPFALRGGFFDGKCITQAPLPDYPIVHIRTGQFVSGQGEVWHVDLPASR